MIEDITQEQNLVLKLLLVSYNIVADRFLEAVRQISPVMKIHHYSVFAATESEQIQHASALSVKLKSHVYPVVANHHPVVATQAEGQVPVQE